MKNTGGYLVYNSNDKPSIWNNYGKVKHINKIQWSCPDCHTEQFTRVKFGNGNHILTCWNCRTKRIVTTISKPDE